MKYSRFSVETLIIGIVYISWLQDEAEIHLDQQNIFKILFVSLVMASKFHQDGNLDNKSFSLIGGISVEELSILEIEFLHILKFDLKVSWSRYLSMLKLIMS